MSAVVVVVALVLVFTVGAFMYLVVRGADKQSRDGDDSHSFAAG